MSYFQRIENKEKWKGLLDKALFKTFFHTLEWESFLESEFSWLKFERYIYNKDQALLSLARVKVSGREKLISHPFCEYGGPLPRITYIDFHQFQRDLFEKFKVPLKISLHPEISFGPQNYFSGEIRDISFSRYSFIIVSFQDQSSNELWQGFRKRTRQAIKKAQNADLSVQKCSTKKELQDFYNHYLFKAKQHRIPAYPYSFFEYFFNSSNAEIILAKYKNKIIAGSVFLFYSGFIHYFLNASSSEGSQNGANHLILWEQMKKYCGQSRYRYFDLGGTQVGSALEVFKSGFGKREEKLSLGELFKRNDEAWDKRGYGSTFVEIYEIKNFSEDTREKLDFARKIWGALPVWAIKKLSPYFLKYKI